MALFGKLFDFNGDGEVDTFEKAAEFAAFASSMDSDEDIEEVLLASDDDDE